MTETPVEEEMIEILYNTHYGGFSVSDKAIELYKKYKKEKNPDSEFRIYEFIHIGRSSPLWVRVFHELGNEFNGKYCNAGVKKIPKKYRYFYRIEEYDGKEEITIDHTGYLLNEIKKILFSEAKNDDKIDELKKIVDEKIW